MEDLIEMLMQLLFEMLVEINKFVMKTILERLFSWWVRAALKKPAYKNKKTQN
jgi:hypothetical protein